jgi:hypothetical protein
MENIQETIAIVIEKLFLRISEANGDDFTTITPVLKPIHFQDLQIAQSVNTFSAQVQRSEWLRRDAFPDASNSP